MVSIEMERTNQRTGCYYAVLGVDRCASAAQVRAAYRKLAMTWHPDRWARGAADSSRAEEAKRRFQQIQEAYDVLSDHRKRTLYDAGLYDPLDEAEDIDGFSGFVEEMMSLMEDVRREDKSSYSLEELQRMFVEMAHGFNESSTRGFCHDRTVHDDSVRWNFGFDDDDRLMIGLDGSRGPKRKRMDGPNMQRPTFHAWSCSSTAF